VTCIRLAATTVVVAVAAVPVGCGSSHPPKSKRVVVTATGRVGPLHVDTSDRADVTSFAGRPKAERRGQYSVYAPFDALGYGCKDDTATDADGIPRCRTVFYLDSRSGKLALVYTEDGRFVDAHGVHAGTPTKIAERLMHRSAFSGCYDGFRLETKTGFLAVWLQGAKDVERRGYGHPVGGRVAFVVVHSRRLNPGVLDCIDS
jgi:hypothetical protein